MSWWTQMQCSQDSFQVKRKYLSKDKVFFCEKRNEIHLNSPIRKKRPKLKCKMKIVKKAKNEWKWMIVAQWSEISKWTKAEKKEERVFNESDRKERNRRDTEAGWSSYPFGFQHIMIHTTITMRPHRKEERRRRR